MEICLDAKITSNYLYENLVMNKTLTTCTAGKLRLGYPESIISEEILLINVAITSVTDFYLHLSILLVEM